MNSQFFSVKAISACVLASAVVTVPSVSYALPWGQHTTCPSVPANQTWGPGWASGGGTITPPYSNGTDCYDTYVIATPDLQVPIGNDSGVYLYYAGPSSTNAQCDGASLAFAVYAGASGPQGEQPIFDFTLNFVESSVGECITSGGAPGYLINDEFIADGQSYRFAIEAKDPWGNAQYFVMEAAQFPPVH